MDTDNFFFPLASRKHTQRSKLTAQTRHPTRTEGNIASIETARIYCSIDTRYFHSHLSPLSEHILSRYRQFHFYSVRFIIFPCVTLYLGCTCHASYNNIGFYEVNSRSMCQNGQSIKRICTKPSLIDWVNITQRLQQTFLCLSQGIIDLYDWPDFCLLTIRTSGLLYNCDSS